MIHRLTAGQREIIQGHQENGAPVKTIPIAKDFGLEVYLTDAWGNNVSGMIRRKSKDKYEIFANEKHPLVRRRFTIAHEIAHFLLHRDLLEDEVFEDYLLRAAASWSNAKIESDANALAADILMPVNLIKTEFVAGTKSIEELAEKFEVSKDSMSIRLLGTSYRSPDRP